VVGFDKVGRKLMRMLLLGISSSGKKGIFPSNYVRALAFASLLTL
jgi:hypothetical protein